MFARALGQIRSYKSERFLNRVTIIGRVGSDAIGKGSQESPVVQFSVATNRDYQPADEIAKPDWHRIAIFKPGLRQLAEKYVKAGSRIYIEGRLTYSTYRNSQNHDVTTASIIADNILFLSPKYSSEYADDDKPDVESEESQSRM